MKKIILSLALFISSGFLFNMNQTAKADCGSDLVNDLQDCIMQNFLSVDVIIGNGVVYLNGAGVTDNHLTGCVESYNGQANNCPSAPTLVVLGLGESSPKSHSGTSINQNGMGFGR